MSSIFDGFFSLGNDVNKVTPSDAIPTPTLLPELELSMDDEELLSLKDSWMKEWRVYEPTILKMQTDNENYWLGQQAALTEDAKSSVDNVIFEALETFLPIATRPKADPTVDSDNSEEGNALATKVRQMLMYTADNVSYNLQLKQVARYWALYLLGVMKVGWSMKENDITCLPLRPQKLILDPMATIQKGEYTGYYIGEMLDDSASDLILRFPAKTHEVKMKVNDKMGTKVFYYMWTTDDYVFWTMDNEVLAKTKNPHWNYDTETPGQMNEFGQPGTPQAVTGKNHFKNRKKPYVFLSMFNLGKHPHDDTNFIQQNIGLQNLVNKRLSQMDKNADNANGGLIISGDSFTEKQAQEAGKALRNGGAVWVPTGDVNKAVMRDSGTPLPNFVYETLNDYRYELRNIFGVRGSSPQGLSGEQTVRGKMFMQQQDQSRIGGGFSVAFENFSSQVYNWFIQLMFVYYDEPHVATVLGKERTQEYISLVNTDFTTALSVGIKEGSMIPTDPVSKREEAMTLWAQKGIDPITFFDRLEFPNPRESAKNLYLWMSDPVALFPDLQMQQQQQQDQQLQMQQQQEMQQQSQDQVGKLQQIHVQSLLKQQEQPVKPTKP